MNHHENKYATAKINMQTNSPPKLETQKFKKKKKKKNHHPLNKNN